MVTLLTSVYHAGHKITYVAGDNVSFSKDGEAFLIEKGMAKAYEEEKKTKVLKPEVKTKPIEIKPKSTRKRNAKK